MVLLCTTSRAGRAIHQFFQLLQGFTLIAFGLVGTPNMMFFFFTPDQRIIDDVFSKEPLKVPPKTNSLSPNDLWTWINTGLRLYGSVWSSFNSKLTSKISQVMGTLSSQIIFDSSTYILFLGWHNPYRMTQVRSKRHVWVGGGDYDQHYIPSFPQFRRLNPTLVRCPCFILKDA